MKSPSLPSLQKKFFQKYVNVQVGAKFYRFQSACFGISTLPYLWTLVMKTFLKKWRRLGILVWIYLDDILVVGESSHQMAQNMGQVVLDLEESGMEINYKKRLTNPNQFGAKVWYNPEPRPVLTN